MNPYANNCFSLNYSFYPLTTSPGIKTIEDLMLNKLFVQKTIYNYTYLFFMPLINLDLHLPL